MRWHRAGFRSYWNWLSRRGERSGRPPLPREVRALIRRMASENSLGAPRIHGELLRLGFEVSERSVSRYLRSLPCTPRAGQTGRPSSGTTGTASPPWTSSRCLPPRSASSMCFSSSATAGATWPAAPSRRPQPLPGSRSSFASPFRSTRHRVSCLRPRLHLLGRRDGNAAVNSDGADADQLPEPLAEWGCRTLRRHRPPGAARPRHRPERAPPTPAA